MKEKKIVTQRSILDVLIAISFDMEVAMFEKNNELASKKEREFNRLKRPAYKLGYTSDEVIKAELYGRIKACIETGDLRGEEIYRSLKETL